MPPLELRLQELLAQKLALPAWELRIKTSPQWTSPADSPSRASSSTFLAIHRERRPCISLHTSTPSCMYSETLDPRDSFFDLKLMLQSKVFVLSAVAILKSG